MTTVIRSDRDAGHDKGLPRNKRYGDDKNEGNDGDKAGLIGELLDYILGIGFGDGDKPVAIGYF